MGRMGLAGLGVAAVLAASAPQLAGASTSPPAPRSALEGNGCHRSSNPNNRWIMVTGVMRPLSGTQRMEMKFELQRKRPDDMRFWEVSGHGLGNWNKPTNPPTLGQNPRDVYRVKKWVLNLEVVPAVYRLRVSFRWLGDGGQILRTVVQLGKRCDQH